jgi:hypothetical protein
MTVRQSGTSANDDYLRLVASWLTDPKNREARGKSGLVVSLSLIAAEQIALRLEDIAAEIESYSPQ